MAKPPPVERFRVHCEVEEAQLGSIVAIFTKMGLTGVGYELITDIRTYRKNHMPAPGHSARDILAPWIQTHPTFKAIEAAQFLEANGSTQNAVYPALKKFCEQKILKALGGGNYQRTDVKAIAAPKTKTVKKAAKKKPAKHPAQTRYEISHIDTIMQYANKHQGKFTAQDLRTHFENQRRPADSAGSALNKLMKQQRIKRVGDGMYEVTSKANGADAHG